MELLQAHRVPNTDFDFLYRELQAALAAVACVPRPSEPKARPKKKKEKPPYGCMINVSIS
jgi:hypothetical protein